MRLPEELCPPEGLATAIVTGGAKRIGAAFVRALAAGGWQVAIHCNQSRDAAQALAEDVAQTARHAPFVVSVDLADPDIGARLLDAASARGVVTLLVNNASRFVEDDLAGFDVAGWDRHMAVNLRAPALLTQAFAERLPDGTGGLIVNITDAKLSALNPDFLSYTISKIGLSGLTEMAARALAPRIRVNAIAPAITLGWGPDSRGKFEVAHVMNPLGRGVEVVHLVQALEYLVATPTITGQTLTLDSGQRFLGLPRDVSHMVKS